MPHVIPSPGDVSAGAGMPAPSGGGLPLHVARVQAAGVRVQREDQTPELRCRDILKGSMYVEGMLFLVEQDNFASFFFWLDRK